MADGRETRLVHRRVLIKVNDYSIFSGHRIPFIVTTPVPKDVIQRHCDIAVGQGKEDMIDTHRCPPPSATFEWVASRFGRRARVVSARRLAGGIRSSVHDLRVVSNDTVHRVVMKRWLDGRHGQPNPLIDRETLLLRTLEGSGLSTPALVAASQPEETDGTPVLLMSRVPGRAWLSPRDPRRWIRQMATTLAGIHALNIEAPISQPWTETPEFELPDWSPRPGAWEEARRLLSGQAPTNTTFIHGDYQHFNLLWTRGSLTGVVDWTWGGRGHPDRDVGHCRLNLAVLFAPGWASMFRDAYQAEAGRRIDPWWDVYEITRYGRRMLQEIPIQVANRIPVDVPGMNSRVEELLVDALVGF
jgi:aminoglycoside phosphotransferase